MSYDIIYDKCFVKVDNDLYMPFIKIGCNNVTDYNGKRERSWNIVAFYNESKMLYTEDELVYNVSVAIENRLNELTKQCSKEICKEMDEKYGSSDYNHKWSLDDYDSSGLKINSKTARYKDILNMYKNGVKHSISLEDFLELNNLVLGYSTFENKDFYKRKKIVNKKDILELAEEYDEQKKLCKKTLYIDLSINSNDDCKIEKKIKEKIAKAKREYEYYFVLGDNNTNLYFKKLSSAHIWLSELSTARKFKTENSAKKYLQMNPNLTCSKIEVIRIDEKIQL